MSDIFFSGSQFFVDAAVHAAQEVGLFATLPASLDELATRLKLVPRGLRILIEALTAAGVVARDGERVTAARVPLATAPVDSGWGRLAEVLRSGHPLDERAHTAEFHRHLYESGRAAADELMPQLGHGALLDVGGGQGTYARAWLTNAAHTSTLIDAPQVASLARRALAPFGARARVLDGDFLDESVGHGFAVALLADVLHLHPPDRCARLVARAAQAIAPGGCVAVKEIRVDADRRGPLGALLFALNMVVYTDGGDVYGPEQIAAWLRDAGLPRVRTITLGAAPESIVVVGAA